MKFTPKTEEELNPLLQDGTWDFEVIKAEAKLSKSGNEMIHILVKVWDMNGTSSIVNDYLISSILYKVRHFCYGTGLEQHYENGDLSDVMCVGRTGKCKGKIEKDKTGQYPDKNIIVDYLEKADAASKEKNAKDEFDDDIPF